MKNFRPRLEYYSIQDLISLDSCFYELYREYRPHFFTNMIKESILKADNSIPDLLASLTHLTHFGLEFP
jgi:hypothetical protein